jgi:dipeptidyl aminopeptidase/acylaminoacyl peptidase
MTPAPGAWPSPLDAADVVAGASVPTAVAAGAGAVWWSETRPLEGGREALVRYSRDGTTAEVLPEGWNVRTRVHEYGGGAWWVHGDVVFCTRWDDQRLYRLDPDGTPPVPLTPEPPTPHAWRYADGDVTPDGTWTICVRERHEGPDVATQVHNEVVAVRTDGGGEPVVLASGRDFVAAPRISRDGRQLAWLAWDHPNMPWNGTELWVARLEVADGALRLADARREAGGPSEALVQPEWGRHGTLYVGSDRSGWWNVYRVDGIDRLEAVVTAEADVSGPLWTLGQRRYVVRRDGTVAAVHERERDSVLALVPEDAPGQQQLLAEQSVRMIADDGERLVGIVVFPDRPAQVRELTPDPDDASAVRRPGHGRELPAAWVSRPRQVTFATARGATAFAWVYEPVNPDVTPDGTLPPLLVTVHGGPTAAARPAFSLGTQYWTSRGFVVADLDYRGSTGYGRQYRDALHLQWGVVDVQDACALAEHLTAQGLVDPARCVIDGGSAGGYTTLLTLFTRDTFAAGASYFGVSDIRGLVEITHKFESRYFDWLVGPWPESTEIYLDRSPITHADRCTRPLLVLQGLEDAVVPPRQAEVIVAALASRGVPHAYLAFEGEQHGFRRAENQIASLEAELSFYGQVLGFDPPGVPVLPVDHAANLPSR